MTFLWGEMLWALLLVPGLIAAYVVVQRRRQKYVLRYASVSLVKEAVGRGPGIRRHVPATLFLIGMGVLIVALARPVAVVVLPLQQGTVILTLDVSGSMRAADLQPTRLEAAKAAARAFVAKQPKNVRIGVVSFSNNAAVVQAPTVDREAVLAAIDRLTVQSATAVGSGILISLDAIAEDPAARPTASSRDPLALPEPTPIPTAMPRGSYSSAVIVLLSDGQSNFGPAPLQAAQQAAMRGVRVYTVGVGNPEGTVLSLGGRSMRVRLDEETLKRIAQETDGMYFRADSDTDLREIYENLSMRLVLKPELAELTAMVAAVGTIFLLLAGTLSLLWFSRLP